MKGDVLGLRLLLSHLCCHREVYPQPGLAAGLAPPSTRGDRVISFSSTRTVLGEPQKRNSPFVRNKARKREDGTKEKGEMK